MKLFLVIVHLALLGGSSWAAEPKVRILFSIDQGFGNGVVANGDVEALTRMVRALEPLRERYEVSVLLNPMIKDKPRLKLMLDALVAQKMPFVFDVYSSDTFTLGANGLANAPFDSSHGQSISVEQLATFKESYGEWLVGLRFMEIFGQDYGIRAMKTTNPELKRPGDKLPEDNYFRPDLAEGFIRFAKEHSMFVQWADFGWMPFSPWDKEMPNYTEQVKALLRKYPGIVTVTYNNNEPNEASIPRLSTWHTAVDSFPKEGAVGYGLSNQSWLHNFTYMNTKPDEIIAWTRSALEKKCPLIQFEPAWYFFNLPAGTFEPGDHTQVPAETIRGAAREPLKKLIEFLFHAGKRPAEVWLVPPPWPGNGQCLREMVQRGDEWKTARDQVRGIGTYAWLLNVHHSDDDLRALFARIEEWKLGFGLEVPVLKAKNWGMPDPLQAQSAFEQLATFTARFRSLGMKEVTWFAFDEPVYGARYAIPASGALVPTAPAIELFGRVKMDPDAAHRIAYAAMETVSFITQMRKAHPEARMGDIEPYPALNPDEIETAINAIQNGCVAKGVQGLDFFRLDVDWDLMEQKTFGSWAEVNHIADMCRARGITFSMVFWAANQPRLVKTDTSPQLWRDGLMHQAKVYREAGGQPDEIVIQSWLHTPDHAVPETSTETFTASALEFLRTYPAAAWRQSKNLAP